MDQLLRHDHSRVVAEVVPIVVVSHDEIDRESPGLGSTIVSDAASMTLTMLFWLCGTNALALAASHAGWAAGPGSWTEPVKLFRVPSRTCAADDALLTKYPLLASGDSASQSEAAGPVRSVTTWYVSVFVSVAMI